MSKAPLTHAETARHLADGERLQYLKARQLFEDLEEAKEQAETYLEKDPTDLLESLAEAIEALSSLANAGVSAGGSDDFTEVTGWVESLTTGLPATETVQQFLDSLERLEQALDDVQEKRDDPSSYDADDKSAARDEAKDALSEVADALDSLESPGNG